MEALIAKWRSRYLEKRKQYARAEREQIDFPSAENRETERYLHGYVTCLSTCIVEAENEGQLPLFTVEKVMK